MKLCNICYERVQMCILYAFSSFKAQSTLMNKLLLICISMSAGIQNVGDSDYLQFRFLAVRFFAVKMFTIQNVCNLGC